MAQMFVIGEDGLSCALGVKLVTDVLGWALAQPALDTKGVTKLVANIPRYMGLAELHPVLCVADTDGQCAMTLAAEWRPRWAPRNFLLRLAVSEAESWLLADREAFAAFLEVAEARIPDRPDNIPDPKRLVVNLARRSRRRTLRQELVSSTNAERPGAGYNIHLREFAERSWRPREAARRSPSLAKALRRLEELKEG